MYKLRFFAFLAAVLTISSAVLPLSGQAPEPTPISNFQSSQEALCTAQPMSVARTYAFRPLPRAPQRAGWFVKKPWWEKIFPFLGKSSETRYQKDDIRYMEKVLGRPIPAERSKKTDRISAAIDSSLFEDQREGDRLWNQWTSENPAAGPEERKRAEIDLRLRGVLAANRPSWDWRKNGIDTGPADFQGWDCATCWAFATVDAVNVARSLALKRGKLNEIDAERRPNASQLVSCMVPEELRCSGNWHGAAFSYMIETGLPVGGSDRYDADGAVHNCDAEASLKPLTWGYLSDAPTKVSPVAEIKEAVIKYGSVVTMMTTDRCLWMYSSGVFNEERFGEGTHILLIIGWDDTVGNKGAWLVKNSYGTDWGDNGYGYIEYGANSIGQFSAVVVADPNEKIVPTKFPAPK